jgi:hypothetical protein
MYPDPGSGYGNLRPLALFLAISLFLLLFYEISCAPDIAEGTGSSGLLVFPVLSGPPPPPHVHRVGGGGREACFQHHMET